MVSLSTGREIVVSRPEVSFSEMRLSPDGRRLAIGDLRGRVHVYQTGTGARRVLAGHTQGDVALALAQNGRWAASASQGELLLWDLEAGGHVRLHGHSEWINDLAFSPDGTRLLSAGTGGSVRLWSAELDRAPPTSPAAVAARVARATSAELDADDELRVASE